MKIACISLGCPKNQVDLDVMVHALLAAGHETVADLAEADVVLVNTCGFIESAKSEAIENILNACAYKKGNPNLKVIVTGCLAERYRDQIKTEIPEVDAVVGCGSNQAICSIVARVTGGEEVESYGAKQEFPLGGKRVIGTPAHYAYLKIAEGCNNRCHYCAIPMIRGPLRSRPLADCVSEAHWLAGEGVKELILVAQDPTAYGEDWGKPGSICALLDALNGIEGLRWIRILYAYPERITDDFIAAMKRNEKVLPYLDLPIQHCNDVILKNMNRRSNHAELVDVIGKLRREIPGITLRTTLIAGFPGETEQQFEELCGFVKEMQFDRLGCFAYSAEENTVAAKMDGQLPDEVKQQRADIIMETQTHIMAQKQAARVGQTLVCLCDGLDEESGLYLLRTEADCPEIDGNVCVKSDTPLYPGTFYKVHITDSDMYDLYGEVQPEDSL
ncbi:MAG: 30S ribosomal protein S12 methylthiotransferase RimO [Faecalibacterium sp.]|nr:30S ribosomal protein S12 methylthiotransferase RimO [Faecalibacterium sp.]